jgi:hypothetical protein
MNKLQTEIFKILKSQPRGVSITPIAFTIDYFRNCSSRKIKYNLTLLEKMDIGIEEEYFCNPDSGYVCSNGFYYLDPKWKNNK